MVTKQVMQYKWLCKGKEITVSVSVPIDTDVNEIGAEIESFYQAVEWAKTQAYRVKGGHKHHRGLAFLAALIGHVYDGCLQHMARRSRK